jgi:hypothetical protein
MNSNTPTAHRTWSLIIPVMLEGAWQMTLTYTVTAFKVGNQIISALVDGVEATLERAAHLLTWAKAEGTLTVLETVEAAQPVTIGKARAHKLHLLLASEGYRGDHHKLAGKILGFEVAHLRDLSEGDARRLWTALTRTGIEVAA